MTFLPPAASARSNNKLGSAARARTAPTDAHKRVTEAAAAVRAQDDRHP
jgi:hypothetical protein